MRLVKLSPRTVINMDQVLYIELPISQPIAALTFATTEAEFDESDGTQISTGITHALRLETQSEVDALIRWLDGNCDDVSVEPGWGGWAESLYGPDPAKKGGAK